MKAVAKLLLAVMIGVSLLVLTALAEAPNSFSFQGRLTDSGGDPVPDGSNTVLFIIWNSPTSTAPVDILWNSGTVSVTTVGGLFSTVLGESPMPDLPVGLFNDTTLWLGITVGAGPELAPRTRLRAVPYALSAGNAVNDHGALSGLADDDHPQYVLASGDNITGDLVHDNARSLWEDGAETVVEIDPSANEINLFDDSGDRTVHLGYDGLFNGWFKLFKAPATDERVRIEASNSFGSRMQLFATIEDGPYTQGLDLIGGDGSRIIMHDQTGSTKLVFDMLTGLQNNSKVRLPDSSVSSLEILDEPGLAHSFEYGAVVANSGTDVRIDSVEITAPANGYVLITVTGYLNVGHVNGTTTNGRVWVSGDGLLDFDNFLFTSIVSSLPTGLYYDGFSLTMVDTVTAYSTSKYIVACDLSSGAATSYVSFSRVHTTAMYFPTNYGDIDFTKRPAVAGYDAPDDPEGQSAPRSLIKTISVAEHEAKLRAELARQQELYEDRISNLENRLDNLERR
ncbi:hypothetical protein KQH82_07605 [bacterium]|nr:hypothetical protein [bacterium]